MLYVLNSNQQCVAVLTSYLQGGTTYFNDVLTETVDDSVCTLEFEVTGFLENTSILEVNGYVLYTDIFGKLRPFVIKEVTYEHSDILVTRVMCEHLATTDLLAKVLSPTALGFVGLQYAAEQVLLNTGWDVGHVDTDITSANIEWEDYSTALEVMHHICKTFKVEMEYEVEFDKGMLVNPIINFVQQKGEETYRTFDYSRDMTSVERVEDSTSLVTALYGVGKDGITFKDYSYTEPTSSDYVKALDAVYSKDALSIYGRNGKHIYGIYSDESENAAELYDNTKKKLAELSKPKITYNCSVATFEKLAGYDDSKVGIGDTVVVRDFTSTPALILKARIVELNRSRTNPELDSLTLGEYIPIDVYQRDRIQAMGKKLLNVERRVGTVNTALATKEPLIVKSATAPSNPTTGTVWIDTSSTALLTKVWNGSSWQSSKVSAEYKFAPSVLAVNGWKPHGTYPPKVSKTSEGFVTFEGVVLEVSAGSGVSGAACVTFPLRFAPDTRTAFMVFDTGGVAARVDVYAHVDGYGVISVERYSPTVPGFFLHFISYMTNRV